MAVAMAYAIADVPSTGNAGFSQGRFLKVRQIPLLIAALASDGMVGLFCNVHGSESFNSGTGLFKFVVFAVATYLSGGVLGTIFLWIRRRTTKSRDTLWLPLLRFGTILVTTAFGGFCLWAVATRVFFNPADSALNYVCFAPAPCSSRVLLIVNFLFTGLASWVSEDQDREWWARSAAWILITIVAWIAINVLVLWGAQALTTQTDNRLAVFLGQVQANPVAKAILGTFGGSDRNGRAFLALRSKFSKALGSRRGSQGILVIVVHRLFRAPFSRYLLDPSFSWLATMGGKGEPLVCRRKARRIRRSSSSSSSSRPPICSSAS